MTKVGSFQEKRRLKTVGSRIVYKILNAKKIQETCTHELTF